MAYKKRVLIRENYYPQMGKSTSMNEKAPDNGCVTWRFFGPRRYQTKLGFQVFFLLHFRFLLEDFFPGMIRHFVELLDQLIAYHAKLGK